MVKNMQKQSLLLPAVAFVALAASGYAIGAGGMKTHVKAEMLIGYHETPSISTVAAGSFAADIDEESETITYQLTYGGLSTPAIFAHIHFGSRFLAGGVAAFVCGGGGKPGLPGRND